MRARVVVIALLIAVLGQWWSLTRSLPVPAAPGVDWPWLTLFVCVALQPLLRRLLGFDRRDTVILFCFLLVGTAAVDGVSRFLPCYLVPAYFADASNNFQMLADRFIPSWFIPKDPEVVRIYFEGSPNEPASLLPWVAPIAGWIVFFMAMWIALFCITALLRRHWVEDERLAFPLATVPLYIAAASTGRLRPRTTIWAEPLMWVGFSLSFLHMLSIMLHAVSPSIPTLGSHTELGGIVTEHPWNVLTSLLWIGYHPTLTALAYFAPQDVCFSMWFFYIGYIQPLRLFWRATGLQEPSGFPFYWEQSAGAFYAIAIVMAWTGRGYLKRVWQAAVRNQRFLSGVEHPWADPLPYRWALIGLGVGFAFLCGWYIAAGMSWWLAVLFFAQILLFATIFTRGRAETGVASLASSPFWQASYQIRSFLGSERLSPGGSLGNLTLLGSLVWLHFGLYPNTMTYQAETLKMAEDARIKTSHMSWAIVGMMLVALLVTFYAFIGTANEFGAIGLQGGTTEGGYHISVAREQYTQVNQVAEGTPMKQDWGRNGFTIGAFVMTFALVALRNYFPRSPFSPIGYVMTLSYGYAYWGPFFQAWLAKVLILRFGGGRLYHQLVPLVIGLVVGHLFASNIVWPIFDLFTPDSWRIPARLLWYF